MAGENQIYRLIVRTEEIRVVKKDTHPQIKGKGIQNKWTQD